MDDLYKPVSNFDSFGVSINKAIPDKNMRNTQFSAWVPMLHPAYRATGAADRRIATEAKYDEAGGRFSIPALSAIALLRTSKEFNNDGWF
ncbi:hypothetical protein ACO0LF_29250 [Undibacterium sp. Di27W]|uniref:hypothetical protein n=1 Tax=Undibacterium sp. Di27W TaxID=3413036 RepID=UPI003BF30BF2